MHAIKVYATREQISDFIKSHLRAEDVANFEDSEWFPIKIQVTDQLEVEAIVAPVK